MPIIPRLPHIKLRGYNTEEVYQYPRTIRVDFPTADRNRAIHGALIFRQLDNLRERFEQIRDEPLDANLVRDDAIYVEFISEWDFSLSFDSLHSDRPRPNYQIVRTTKEFDGNNPPSFRFRTLVMLTKGGISHFISHVKEYLNPERDLIRTDDLGEVVGTNPKHNKLFANLENIQIATLKAFWTDNQNNFPNDLNEVRWWEVWFRRTDDDQARFQRVSSNLITIGAAIGQSQLIFPEHFVRLVRASARQLASSLLLLDNLAELRRPQETADCFLREGLVGREQWVTDLVNRVEAVPSENQVLICLLDTGVNNQHALLGPFLPDERLYSFRREWGTHDSWQGEGHGTGMAGLALYGDLTDALTSPDRIVILHGLESYKIIQYDVQNEPELYGSITINACNEPVIDNPQNPRVFCLSITDANLSLVGRPSSWSATIDRITFGNNEAPPQLFVISGGNVVTNRFLDYPSLNEISSIHDPGQSYNAITVGSYTNMDRININQLPGWNILAPRGGMSPSNSTSLTWENQWPIKPDIVMEGGNLATNNIDVAAASEIQLLSTSKRHRDGLFQRFGDTSGAAALASKMAAEIMVKYPDYWPETIRALIIHSAQYTLQMLGGRPGLPFTASGKRELLRKFGYGVPNLNSALYSASNSLHMIMERTILPYQQVGNDNPKYNQYHLYELPWPADLLRTILAESNVKLKVTLSYFIEPNPGDRRYANNFQYHSHALDFLLIKPTEPLADFRRRVSKAAEEEGQGNVDLNGETWDLKAARSKGSIKKDYITCSGADLSTRNILAVYPKNGWYKSRKKLKKANSEVRYSLIISIDTDNVDVSIYNTVIQVIPV